MFAIQSLRFQPMLAVETFEVEHALCTEFQLEERFFGVVRAEGDLSGHVGFFK